MPRIVFINPKSPIDLGIPISVFLTPESGDESPAAADKCVKTAPYLYNGALNPSN